MLFVLDVDVWDCGDDEAGIMSYTIIVLIGGWVEEDEDFFFFVELKALVELLDDDDDDDDEVVVEDDAEHIISCLSFCWVVFVAFFLELDRKEEDDDDEEEPNDVDVDFWIISKEVIMDVAGDTFVCVFVTRGDEDDDDDDDEDKCCE